MADPKAETKTNGPVEERTCTDILCCLFFVLSIIGLFITAITSFVNGELEMLTAVYDSSGHACGQLYKKYQDPTNSSWTNYTADLTTMPYLYFSTPYGLDYFPYKTACVSKCPNTTADGFTSTWCNTLNNKNVTSCTQNKCTSDSEKATLLAATGGLPSAASAKETLSDGSVMCFYQTTTLVNRFCIPANISSLFSTQSASKQIQDRFNSFTNTEQVQKWIAGVTNAKYIILAGFFIAFGAGGIYMIIVRYFAGLLVWLSIIAFIGLEFALAIYCLNRATAYQTAGDDNNYQAMRVVAYCIFGCGAATIVLVLCMWEKIRLGIAIIKTAALYIRDVPLSMLIPVITSFISIAWIVIWIVIFVYTVATFDSITKYPSWPIASPTWNNNQKLAIAFVIFMGLWINAFFQAFEQFVLVASVCIWYFAQNDPKGLHLPILRPLKWGITKHLGSLAFGSFILALVQFIRLVLAYMQEYVKKTMPGNKCMQYFIACLQCYVACFERFIKFLNKNAYIQIALKSTNFCTSAKNAMSLLWDNAGRASIVQGMGGIFVFVGEGFVCLLTSFICYVILTTSENYKSYSPWLPLIVIFFIAYTIGSLFMSIYGMAMDAILQCFCQDEKDNGVGKAKNCPELLRDFLDKNVKEEVKKEEKK